MAAWVKGRQGGRQRQGGEGARAQAGKRHQNQITRTKQNHRGFQTAPPFIPPCFPALYTNGIRSLPHKEKNPYIQLYLHGPNWGRREFKQLSQDETAVKTLTERGREGPPVPTRKNTPSPPHEDLKLGIVMGSKGVRKHHRQLPAFNSQGGRRDRKESPAPTQASLALSFTKRQNSIYIFFTQL